MAAPGTQNVNVPAFSYETRQADIERRMKLAQALQESGQAEQPEFSYRGILAPTSPLSGLAKALQLGLGAYQESSAYEDQRALAQETQDRRTADMSKFVEMLNGSTAPGTAAVLPNTPNASAGEPQQYPGADLYRPQPQNLGTPSRIIPGDSQAAFTALAASPLGDLQQMGVQGLLNQANQTRSLETEIEKEKREQDRYVLNAETKNQNEMAAARLKAESDKSSGGSNLGRPASAIQLYEHLQLLTKTYGANSPEVKRFEEIVNADPTLLGEKALLKELGQNAANTLQKDFESGKNAQEAIKSADALITKLNDPKLYVGFAANANQFLNKLRAGFEAAGGTYTDKAKAHDVLRSLLVQETYKYLSALGMGSKNFDTPRELEIFMEGFAGTTGFTKKALIELAEIRKKSAQGTLEEFNDKGNRGVFDKLLNLTGGGQFRPLSAGKPTEDKVFIYVDGNLVPAPD